MTLRISRGGIALIVVLAWACSAHAAPSFSAVVPSRAAAEVFNYDRFGQIHVYRGRGRLHDVVLLMSGDSGWDGDAGVLAQRLADKGALVAGMDIRRYREQLEKAPEACVSPASDFENLSHYLQSKLELKKYQVPILVGYESGATLVYATLAEAPEGLFKGALSIGFCPDLDLKKPLCDNPAMDMQARLDAQGAMQGMTFTPAKQLPGKWIAVQGSVDSSCPVSTVQKFVARVPGAEIMPHFDDAFARLIALHVDVKPSALPSVLADLPLTIVPATVPAAAGGGGGWFGVFLTGDGGWVGLDKGVSLELAKHDIPIVGWDSLKYFWSRRTPDGAARDLDRVMRYYSRAWGRSHALLIGYSQGADTMPFMINRLPPATHALVGYTTLLGISDNAVWEFHVANWLGNPTKGVPTAPELDRWTGSPYLCIYGESDGDAACEQLTGHDGTALKLSGGHHFGGSYAKIANEILSRLPAVAVLGAQPHAD